MTKTQANHGLLFSVILLGTAGCGVLPETGPSAHTLQTSEAVTVVDVTPAQAQEMADHLASVRNTAIDQALDSLSKVSYVDNFVFSPGDTFELTLFSISPWLTTGMGGTGSPGAPTATDLGRYTVSAQGTVVLPYIGSVVLAGLRLDEAQHSLAQRFAALGLFQDPSARIDVGESPQNSILVTGALGAPRRVAWRPSGVTLDDAITQSLGNGLDILGSDPGASSDRSAIDVSIFRGKEPAVTIPMQAALERQIALLPGDRVVVSKKPTVRVVVLGGGVSKNGNFEYARNPTLATVLAQASGLDINVANDRAVFVLESHGHDQKPVLYDFAWNRDAGLIASQVFPMSDGDLVYVDEALIVPVQKVIDTLFGVAAVANLAK
jgi:polysaccharide export outer membrane protein